MHFRAAEAGAGWAAVLACSAEVHLLAAEVDFREPADESLALVVDSPSPVADFSRRCLSFSWPAADFRALAAGSPGGRTRFGPVVDSREPEVELLAPGGWFSRAGG